MKELNSLDLFRQVFEQTNQGVWIVDAQLQSVLCNPSLCHLFELVPKNKNQVTVEEIIPRDSNRHFYEVLNNWETPHSAPSAFEINLCTGLKKWFTIQIQPVLNDKTCCGKTIYFTDISKEKEDQVVQTDNFNRYFSLFEDSPIPIWEEDFSQLKIAIDELQMRGVLDFNAYLQDNPSEIDRLASSIIINKINNAVVELNEATSKEHVLKSLKDLRSENFVRYLIYQVQAIAKKEASCEFDAQLITTKGNIRHVLFKWTVVKGYEKNYGRVYLTTTDLTARIIEENIFLSQANRDKEILLREIHHRVKNNFQIISSLIRLQADMTQAKQVSDVFHILLNRIYSMATVHELLYRSEKLEAIQLQDYLTHLLQLLTESLQSESEISLDIEAADIHLSLDHASPLGLIINEIVTNSIKHAFKKVTPRHLYIRAFSDPNNQLVIQVGDNGIGKNRNAPASDSLGLSLVDSLVEQLNGTIMHVDQSPGTHYLLSFPL